MSSSPQAWPEDACAQRVLATRPLGAIDRGLEDRTLDSLAEALARGEREVLQRLADAALSLCGAQSAGISLIELDNGASIFRWHAVAGRWSGYLMGFMPRKASPCGVVVDRHAPQLMANPELYFPEMNKAEPLAEEALLVPFDVLGETVGTVWVVSHDPSVKFAAEHLRVMQRLANFAAAAYLVRATLAQSLEAREELTRANDRLNRENERLRARLAEQPVAR
ncbi:MAG TPA: GAF domain-containing protein [Usitatibacter sp.]|nr:GAF domain-containing protein [Usitatibacter sp.]